MRILYLCHRVPYPPDKGDKIRAFHEVRALAERHEVDLFTMADDPADLAHVPELRRLCAEVTVAALSPLKARIRALPALLTRTPLTVPYFYSEELSRAVRRAILRRSYDRVVVFSSAMAQYVEASEIPAVLDLVDVDSDKWTQYAGFSGFPFAAMYRREGKRLREYEQRVCERAAFVLVTTAREALLVRQIAPMARVEVVSNGVNADYFNPREFARPPAAKAIIFTGDMSYFPNEEAVSFFAREVLPLIHRSEPDASFLIVGRNPTRRVQQLREIRGVLVTGFVPDVRPYLAESRVAVAPFSIAAGIQNKVLEAMAFAVPVVATPRATQGLAPCVAEGVDTGETPEALAGHVVRLLRDPLGAERRGREGRSLVTAEYSWGRMAQRLQSIVERSAGAEMVERELLR